MVIFYFLIYWNHAWATNECTFYVQHHFIQSSDVNRALAHDVDSYLLHWKEVAKDASSGNQQKNLTKNLAKNLKKNLKINSTVNSMANSTPNLATNSRTRAIASANKKSKKKTKIKICTQRKFIPQDEEAPLHGKWSQPGSSTLYMVTWLKPKDPVKKRIQLEMFQLERPTPRRVWVKGPYDYDLPQPTVESKNQWVHDFAKNLIDQSLKN